MAEYIERSAAIEAAKHAWAKGLEPSQYIEAMPAADVAPVVHGRWIDGKCSNCGVDIPTDDAHDVIFGHECHFCYYCGAMMDGERKDGANG